MRRLAAGIGVGILLGSLTYANAQTTKTIIMRGACDPASFNAAVGPGTCVSGNQGNTLFSDFIGELQSDHIAAAWRFNPLLNATEGHFNDSERGRRNAHFHPCGQIKNGATPGDVQ